MQRTSTYRVRLKTDSDDSDAPVLLVDGELIAILVQLADECHGDERGNWIVEATFGFQPRGGFASFASAAEAANWVSGQLSEPPFALTEPVAELH